MAIWRLERADWKTWWWLEEFQATRCIEPSSEYLNAFGWVYANLNKKQAVFCSHRPTGPSPVFADLRGAVPFAFASKTNGGSGTAFRIERLCTKLVTRARVFYTMRRRHYGTFVL